MKIKLQERKSGFISTYEKYSDYEKHENKEKIKKEEIIEVNSFQFAMTKICAEMKREGYSCVEFYLMFERKNDTGNEYVHDVDFKSYWADDFVD